MCAEAIRHGRAVFSPHQLYPQFLDAQDHRQRTTAARCALAFLSDCDEIWVAEAGIPTPGMELGVDAAIAAGLEFVWHSPVACGPACTATTAAHTSRGA